MEPAEKKPPAVSDLGAWGMNVVSSVGLVMANKQLMPSADYAFSFVFRYGRGAHNVVAVSAAGYKSCSAARGGRTYNSGSDRVTLARGTNYFICSVPGHCQAGMKMAVTAA